MGFLGILLLIFFLLSALLLVVIVLVQDEGGEGLGGIFGGGGAGGQVGNRSGNILTKTTSVLGAIFLLTSFGLAWLNRTPEASNVESAARQIEAEEQGTVNWWETEDETAPADEAAPGSMEESN